MRVLKFLGRVLLGLFVLVGIIVVILGGLLAFDSLLTSRRVSEIANVSYPGINGVTLQAYFVQPESPEPLPSILLVHEFYGLNESIVRKADLLAEQGYTVLAVDAYRGRSTSLLPRAVWLLLTSPQERIDGDLDAGLDYLMQLEEIDPQRIGLVGFCFGGTQVMRLGARNPAPAATVIFYGSNPPSDPAGLGALGAGGPVLGIFGAEDRQIPLAQVYAFQEVMVERDIRHRMSIYPGVGHAFVTYESLFFPGPAQDAWEEMLEFLEEALAD